MTSKIYNNPDFPDEYEVKINEDFEKGREFLKSLNLKEKAYQESWGHHTAHEITFDLLPGLLPYMELYYDSGKNFKRTKRFIN
jgi:hypothetical protein